MKTCWCTLYSPKMLLNFVPGLCGVTLIIGTMLLLVWWWCSCCWQWNKHKRDVKIAALFACTLEFRLPLNLEEEEKNFLRRNFFAKSTKINMNLHKYRTCCCCGDACCNWECAKWWCWCGCWLCVIFVTGGANGAAINAKKQQFVSLS